MDTLYNFSATNPKAKGTSFNAVGRAQVGTVLKEKISDLLKIKTGGTCGCQNLASKMNRWGPDGCEARRDEIVDRLVANSSMLVDALAGVDQSIFKSVLTTATALSRPALRIGASWLLTQAIEESKARAALLPVPKPKSPKSTKSKTTMGRAFRYIPGKDDVRFVSSQQFQEDIKLLIGKLPPDITAIAGVARSGLSAATMISMYLHLPMITIRQTMNDIVPTGNGWRLGGTKHVDPKGKILVLDDTVMTGNSLRAIRPLVQRELGDALYASVYCNPNAAAKPDIWAVDLPWPHLLEWNIFNSILSTSMACDFDGILCQDCPAGSDDDGPKYLDFINNAKPLYVPRRVPIPLIVTARIEKYRQPTEDWLQRHGIKCHNLIMHPAATLKERQRDDVAAYKARHYQAWASNHRAIPGPNIFCESDDRQARRIAALSKFLTICPATSGCYQ
jgi:adenine/guanine phosphoribosyltransferase-like PRPP-binding protein